MSNPIRHPSQRQQAGGLREFSEWRARRYTFEVLVFWERSPRKAVPWAALLKEEESSALYLWTTCHRRWGGREGSNFTQLWVPQWDLGQIVVTWGKVWTSLSLNFLFTTMGLKGASSSQGHWKFEMSRYTMLTARLCYHCSESEHLVNIVN